MNKQDLGSKLGYLAGIPNESFKDGLNFLHMESADGIVRFPKTAEEAILGRVKKGADRNSILLFEVYSSPEGFNFLRIQNYAAFN